MVMGADDTVLENNVVKGNHSAGIVVVRLAEEHALKDPELDPLTDGLRVGFNQLVGNGRKPHPLFVESVGGGADIVWDGTGTGNCADLPDQVTRAGAPLPSCMGMPSAEAIAPLSAGMAVPDAAIDSALDDVELPSGHVIFIRGMRYEPHHLEIAKGATVTWVNMDGVTHTVTSGEGTTATSAPLASPFLQRGEIYSHTFGDVGEYEYLCLPHLDQAPMRGATVTVRD
jgi:plastocyanin